MQLRKTLQTPCQALTHYYGVLAFFFHTELSNLKEED